ncbi:hypothetical protein PSTT_05245 [Puccinia striiformis]|uniref:Uncharacterized protein n=1 Tax=Puccinia striiformis TaxID=27350 RepID=A0A2S4VPN6_9BASI|nr:hypothetical protein PSTT_05245 [Puccinia striiformis]
MNLNFAGEIAELRPFDHKLLHSDELSQIKYQDYSLSIHRPTQKQTEKKADQNNNQDIWGDLYLELSNKQSQQTEPNLIFSWDSFNRPICSQSALLYQTPYPVEESISVWEAILSTSQLNLSSPIDRTTFIKHFFRRSIGLKTPTPTTEYHLRPRPEENVYPRVSGQTDRSTRSLYDLSDSAFTNLSVIENFIKQTHHPYHPHQSLSSGLAVLIDWIRTEIMDSFEHESVLNSGLLTMSLIIDPLYELLNALQELIRTCQESRKSSQEDAVYQHLDLHIRRSSSNLIQAVFSWLLDRVCAALLLSWQTWLGVDLDGQRTLWPDEKDQLYQTLWSHHGIQLDPRYVIKNPDYEDLTGHRLDQTGPKPPSTYCFRPDRVPSFIPISLAESIFKAGVSLRILRRSNPFHPICLAYPVEEHGQSRWVWTPQDLKRAHTALSKQRRDMKIEISAWRHGIKLSDDPLLPIRRSREVYPTSAQDIEQAVDIEDFLEAISTGLKPYDTQVGGSRHIDQRRKGLIEALEDRLRHCQLGSSGLLHSIELPSLDILTEVTVLESLRCRSLEIDRCLLSFFLIDLDFLDHLKVLDQFMFCNDVMFNQRLTNALFSPNEDTFSKASRRPVGVSARLLRRGTWPPGGFDLSFALRTVILDSVAPDQRPAAYRESSAWTELEDRLSFAIRPGIENEAGELAYKAESIDGFGFLMIDFKPPEALRSLLGTEPTGVSFVPGDNTRPRLLPLPEDHDNRNGLEEGNSISMPSISWLHIPNGLLDGLVSYTWEIAIGSTCGSFINRIEQVKEAIQSRERWKLDHRHSSSAPGDNHHQDPYQSIESVEQLNKLHKLNLTEIMNCLFLRSKQESYLSLLSRSIFDTIIEFSVHLEQEYRGFCIPENDTLPTTMKMMMITKKKLLKALDQLHQRSVDLQSSSSAHNSSLEQGRKIGFLKELILRLDFNSFFFSSSSLSLSDDPFSLSLKA